MKKLLFLGMITALASCSSGSNNTSMKDSSVTDSDLKVEADSTAMGKSNVNGTYNFLHTEGRDSTLLDLDLQGEKVTGEMRWSPWEKDSRKGILEGVRKGDTILVTWKFMQEGMQDTLALKFKYSGKELLQKPLKLNQQSGRDQTDESADYSIKFLQRSKS